MKRSVLFSIAAATTLTTACQPALIYGERTSYSLASVNLNDEVSQPVQIKIGAYRSVATVAPPRGGQGVTKATGLDNTITEVRGDEAVSVFSKFDLDYLGNRGGFTEKAEVPLWSDNLNIRTQFASGNAAVAIAGNPEAVKQIMGITGRVESQQGFVKRDAIVSCIRAKDSTEFQSAFRQSAEILELPGLPTSTTPSAPGIVKQLVVGVVGSDRTPFASIATLPIARGCPGASS